MTMLKFLKRKWLWAPIGAAVLAIGSCSQTVLPDDPGFATKVPDDYRNRAVNVVGDQFFEIGPSGTPTVQIAPAEFAGRIGRGTPIVMIHGSNYDTEKTGLDNPHLTIYEVMRDRLAAEDQYTLVGIGWSSVRFTLANFFSAWSQGLASPYSLTRKNTAGVVDGLDGLLPLIDKPYVIMCHSIGCDITSRTLARIENLPSHVVMFSPDTHYQTFHDWAVANEVRTLHVVAERDGSLAFSQYADVNEGFLPSPDQEFYQYQIIDVAQLAPNFSRSDNSYGNPRRYWDHMATFELKQLWPCYIAFLENADAGAC